MAFCNAVSRIMFGGVNGDILLFRTEQSDLGHRLSIQLDRSSLSSPHQGDQIALHCARSFFDARCARYAGRQGRMKMGWESLLPQQDGNMAFCNAVSRIMCASAPES